MTGARFSASVKIVVFRRVQISRVDVFRRVGLGFNKFRFTVQNSWLEIYIIKMGRRQIAWHQIAWEPNCLAS